MNQLRTVRNVANAVNLSTPLGLILATVGKGKLRRVGSLLVAEHVQLPVVNASAMTVGSVVLVLGRSLEEAEAGIPDLIPMKRSTPGSGLRVWGCRSSCCTSRRPAGRCFAAATGHPQTRSNAKRDWPSVATRSGPNGPCVTCSPRLRGAVSPVVAGRSVLLASGCASGAAASPGAACRPGPLACRSTG